MSANSVLGHYPAYVEVADQLGAARFAVPIPVWKAWDQETRWSKNCEFLDESLRRGRFLLATSPTSARPGSVFLREIGYLQSQGHPMVATHRMEVL